MLAGELGPRGIRVNAIAPGSVPTPATEGFVTPEQYEQRAKGIPLRRNGTPEDVAKAAAFLLSDEAEFINGAMLADRRRHHRGGIGIGMTEIWQRAARHAARGDPRRHRAATITSGSCSRPGAAARVIFEEAIGAA